MYQGLKVCVVVPAYREEARVADVVRTMPSLVDRIIVVDDASPDATFEAASSVSDPRLEVIRLPQNLGVGGAIITGHRRAIELGCDVSVVMAGDGQMDPARLPDLLDPIASGRFEFSKGNRFFPGGALDTMPRYRVFGNVVLTFLTKAASGYWHLFDPQNGYTAVRTDTLQLLPLDRVAERYDFENDMLIWLATVDAPAVDVPIPARYGDETSTVKLLPFILRTLRTLFVGFWRRIWVKEVLRSFSPVAALLFAGIALLLIGLIVGAVVAIASIGDPSPTAGTVLLAVAPVLLGVILMLQALLLDIGNSPGGQAAREWSREAMRRAAARGPAD